MNRRFSTNKSERGQGLVEYVLTAILTALVGVGVWMTLGVEIKATATNLTEAVSGGISVHDGVVFIPNISPTLTPMPTASPTPTIPACTPGNAINVTSKNACNSLRDMNYCENYNYSSKKDTCSWH